MDSCYVFDFSELLDSSMVMDGEFLGLDDKEKQEMLTKVSVLCYCEQLLQADNHAFKG